MSRGRKGWKNMSRGSGGSGGGSAPLAIPKPAVLPETPEQEKEKYRRGVIGYLTFEDLIADCRQPANDDYPGMFCRPYEVFTGPPGQIQSSGAYDSVCD